MTDDRHILYAVLDTIHGPHRVRLSRALPYAVAVAAHEALHRRLTGPDAGTYNRPIVRPGFTVYGRPVAYFAVRSAADPEWPATRPVLTLSAA